MSKEKQKDEINKKKKIPSDIADIRENFKYFWGCLTKIIVIYVSIYLAIMVLAWSFGLGCGIIVPAVDVRGKSPLLIYGVAISLGILAIVDSYITTYLKNPLGQLTYTISACNSLDREQRYYLAGKSTGANEYCRETLRRFGMMSVAWQIPRVLIEEGELIDKMNYYGLHYAIVIGYLAYVIPLVVAAYSLYSFDKRLTEIEKAIEKEEKNSDN